MNKFDIGYAHIPAFYRHNNGELDPVFILDYDGKGNCWIRWKKDDFINMMPMNRIVRIQDE
jgi:hypothetical protein